MAVRGLSAVGMAVNVDMIEWLTRNYQPGINALPKDRHLFKNAVATDSCEGRPRVQICEHPLER